MLEGRVALITGAGRGIGREHALLLGRLGARVLVNDRGVHSDGSGVDNSAAEQVAAEIRAAGGDAIANTDSVADFASARSMIAQAVDSFGRLDAVVNNAGILRDRMLVSMSESDFDDVVAVHLKGTFNVSRFAAEYWRAESKGGAKTNRAIVNTSSGAGLHGNVGQTNYSAAKAGIAAMTVVHAAELNRYGVRANCIAPIASTRLTLQTPGFDQRMSRGDFDPGNISPLVAYLASERCPFTGQVFSVYGGTVGIYAGWSTVKEVHREGRWDSAELGRVMEAEFPLTVETNNPFRAALSPTAPQ